MTNKAWNFFLNDACDPQLTKDLQTLLKLYMSAHLCSRTDHVQIVHAPTAPNYARAASRAVVQSKLI